MKRTPADCLVCKHYMHNIFTKWTNKRRDARRFKIECLVLPLCRLFFFSFYLHGTIQWLFYESLSKESRKDKIREIDRPADKECTRGRERKLSRRQKCALEKCAPDYSSHRSFISSIFYVCVSIFFRYVGVIVVSCTRIVFRCCCNCCCRLNQWFNVCCWSGARISKFLYWKILFSNGKPLSCTLH